LQYLTLAYLDYAHLARLATIDDRFYAPGCAPGLAHLGEKSHEGVGGVLIG
jgi:hypothetical protein